MVRLAVQICHLEVAVMGQNVVGNSHRMWDLRAQGQAEMTNDHLAESAVLSNCCHDSHSYGHRIGRHCCDGGYDDDFGRDHVVVRHLGRDCGRCAHLVHVRHCILRPCYAFGSGPRSGHAAGRQVGTEDGYPRKEESVNLWARGPYAKDERKP